jgi:hypothetical protein
MNSAQRAVQTLVSDLTERDGLLFVVPVRVAEVVVHVVGDLAQLALVGLAQGGEHGGSAAPVNDLTTPA